MGRDWDVGAFEARATSYERCFLGQLHRDIAQRTAELLLAIRPEPERVLNVGCGTGYLLRLIAERCPASTELAGVDPVAAMISVAESSATDDRLWFGSGVGAENLPFGSDTFDVVVATTSFDHWSDQRAGLLECARVLKPEGRIVLFDLFSALLLPTLLLGRYGKARTKRAATRLLESAGFHSITWHRLYSPLIKAAVATR